MYILLYLFSKRCGRDNLESLQKVVISWKAWLVDKHAGVEVQRWLRTKLGLRPRHLVGALLAVANLILRRMAPCLLTETVFNSVEVAVRKIELVIYVLKYLYVSV